MMKRAWLTSCGCSPHPGQGARCLLAPSQRGRGQSTQWPRVSTDLAIETITSSSEWGSPWVHGLFKMFRGRGRTTTIPPNLHTPSLPGAYQEICRVCWLTYAAGFQCPFPKVLWFWACWSDLQELVQYLSPHPKKQKQTCKTKRSTEENQQSQLL